MGRRSFVHPIATVMNMPVRLAGKKEQCSDYEVVNPDSIARANILTNQPNS